MTRALQLRSPRFSNMRRAITLILYLALIVAGLYLNLWIYQTQTDARFTVLMVGIFLVLFGGYMLWTDFLSPNRDKT
jgi:quinol-cytochrome oxidoreductase complex cytochrome b subunit